MVRQAKFTIWTRYHTIKILKLSADISELRAWSGDPHGEHQERHTRCGPRSKNGHPGAALFTLKDIVMQNNTIFIIYERLWAGR